MSWHVSNYRKVQTKLSFIVFQTATQWFELAKEDNFVHCDIYNGSLAPLAFKKNFHPNKYKRAKSKCKNDRCK